MLDVLAAVLVIAGALVALVAAFGVVKFGDARTAMHAATKPATLGVLLCATGAMIGADDVSTVTKIVVVVGLQFVTAPVGAHMLSRAITFDQNPDDDSVD